VKGKRLTKLNSQITKDDAETENRERQANTFEHRDHKLKPSFSLTRHWYIHINKVTL
jgi:hypothetical protein